MRRKDRETSEDMAWAIFDKANHAVISVVDQAGKPYSVPMLVARKERSVYYPSFFRGHMYEIMETSPDVCITSISIASVVPKSNDLVFASAILFGKGHVVEDDEEKMMATRLICEKVAADNLDKFESKIPFSLPHLGVVRIDISKITGKANLPGVSQDAL